ncbi:GNAT family N-acetyltransferase [Streptomyces zaomyceticus]|uniref:GNAT family N-acetyltransferase n=1 Tax=Streptomyces zaomyceticus TaxID=68286 RepID=UPI00167AEC22|nr:GNAT family N-acetyltransferase [Streptomyces zaomyceticus]GHG12741.1 aminoglycoside N(6')-acetyltransferase [Streptomyces zaomyceticus]
MITWRRVTEDDFPLLRRWLSRPHVARWWNHETDAAAVARDFGPVARGEEPAEDWIALLDGVPLGLVQRCLWDDYPEYLAELASVTEVPRGAATIDYLIGDPEFTGRGVGPRVIGAMIERTWLDHPGTPSVLVPVVAANRASWRALEKAGLVRVAEGEMEPDNPIDDRLHYVYRIDRPPVGGATPHPPTG